METSIDSSSKTRRWALGAVFIAAFVFWNGVCPSIHASEVAAQFPEVNQVAADYPDDAARFVALNSLWNFLHEKAPTEPDAIAKRSAYYNASTAVSNKYVAMGGQAADDYNKRVEQLTFDRNFTRSVLGKYRLLELASVPSATPAQMQNTDVTDSMIQGATMKALPYLLASLVAMYLIAKLMVRNTVASPSAPVPPPVAVGDLPTLPESLRVVQLPGVQYSVETLSGLVLEKETEVHTSYYTTTTPGQAYTMGNEVYTTPGQTSTSSSTTKQHTIWLRTPEGRETSWTFTGDAFKMRPGHIISILARRLPSGVSEFMLAYNHATGQLEELSYAAHRTRGRWAWLVATLVGSVGFGIGIFVLLSIQPDPDPMNRMLAPIVDWIEGLIPTALVALIVVMKVQGSAMRRRQARFANKYLPGFIQFFRQATPFLQRHFGTA